MRDPDYGNDKLTIEYLVQNAVVTLADTVFLVAAEFLGAIRAWLVRQCPNFGDDPPAVFARYRLQFF